MTDHPLIAFDTARLDEEEAAAKAAGLATPGSWQATGEDIIGRCDDPHWDGVCAANASGAEAEHIARQDPQAVLASVAADRRILARWTALQSPVMPWDHLMFPSLSVVVLDCIRDRAARFRDHPDYDPAWELEMTA